MSDQQENLENFAMALYVYAAQLIKEGKTHNEIIDILMQRGVSRQSAETIMTRLNQSRDNVTRKSGYMNIAFGLVVIILSLFPIFGVIIDQVTGVASIVAIILMAIGVVIAGRGLMKVFGV